MTSQVVYLSRICMDCGKDFTAVIEEKSKKPLNCWYWGDIKPDFKYQYFIKMNWDIIEHEDERPMWQRWLRENLPGYCYSDEEPIVKSIYKRWYLLLRQWLDRTPKVEMWTCPECVEVEERRGLDTCPE